MRKLTAALFVSVDGVVESPNRWQFDSFDDELAAEMTSMIDRVDTVLLGRIGYEEWKGYWPKVQKGDPFGDFINPVEKFIASRTLTGEQEWQNTSVIDGTLEQFVAAQKNLAGGEISVCGSISVVRQLFFAGLLDSLTLMMHPIIAGAGRHLFEPTDPVTRLILQNSRSTPTGNTILSYGVRAV